MPEPKFPNPFAETPTTQESHVQQTAETEPSREEILDKAVELMSKASYGEGIDEFYKFLEKNEKFHKDIVLKLIEEKYGHYVVNIFDKFSGLDHQDMALKFIEAGLGAFVAQNLNKFHGLDHEAIALKLIEAGDGNSVAYNLPSFQGLDKELAFKLIEASEEGAHVAYNMDKFPRQDHAAIALKLFEKRRGNDVALNLESFHGLDHKAIALKLIEAGLAKSLADNINKFKNLDKEVALKLIDTPKASHIVYQHPEKFHGLDAEVTVRLKYLKMDLDIPSRPELVPNESSPEWVRDAWALYDDPKMPLKIRESQENADAVVKSTEQQRELLPKALRARLTCKLSPHEYLWIASETDPAMLDSRQLIERIKGGIDQNLGQQLDLGSEIFGDKNMLEYMNRADMIRHDALHFMPQLIAVFKNSGLSADEFAKNILLQVAKDQSSDETGTAHHKLAMLCQSLENSDPEEIKNKLKQYSNVEALQKLAQGMDMTGSFTSWKAMKKYCDVISLLNKTEVLDQLNDPSLSPKMRAFVEKLAFHPNIAMDSVMQFWREPAKFLGIDDRHTDQQINQVKKPSNYISLPYLGLTAEDLRDAYVEGNIDQIQTLPPMESEYSKIGLSDADNPETSEGLHNYLIKALGQERKGVKGQAKRPKKLFDNVKRFCKENALDFGRLVSDPVAVAGLDQAKRATLHELVFDAETGMNEPEDLGETYRVRLGRKSDPDMTVAGNDTASCMPFGSGKNNVYMFNPNCVQLVLERRTEDGKWRTAAQSVVTIDHKATKKTPELINGYKEHQALKDLFEAEDFANLPVVTCDNIEIAKNEEGKRSQNIRQAYELFFKKYLAENALTLGVDPTRVAIGTGYTPDALGLKKEENHYVPQAPMGYSDNVHDQCYVMETGLPAGERLAQAQTKPLIVRDAIAAAYIEGKAYADNDSLMEYLHKVQNNIIGSQIANEYFHRPNLSFITKDERGVPQGYMVAYEGKAEDKPMVYISDLAADPENKIAGVVLVRKFLRSYFEAYGVANKPYLPIFTNAREKTSYQWILKLAEAEAKKRGCVVELFETGTYKQGTDTMHNIYILIGKDKQEIEMQKKEIKL
ncbi:MAG: hypothetical protein PHC53_00560 [Patescibacteria group bacterium]|nr:hypothetical protein [Patescibacteria group bacterium]